MQDILLQTSLLVRKVSPNSVGLQGMGISSKVLDDFI
jgi:hypothetical protein